MDKRIELLAQQVETWYKNMFEFVFKHTAFQLVVLGWILSSKNSVFDGAESYVRYTIIISLLLYSAVTSGVYLELKSKSKYCFLRLKAADEEITSDFFRFLITSKFLWSSILTHFAISIVSGWLVWMVPA
ncbi:MAG: hypothetical protein BM560_01075 [Roseobacter sp. MedPE-SWde]|nr:MAG: hypothetical protein BM560_01075 [Roseobacter sp. MedPE-SWde]